MIASSEKEMCTGCFACASACPMNCIIMKEDKEGFFYPSINTEKCIECGVCKEVCPAIVSKDYSGNSVAYAAINKNLEQRLASSSGGIFILLAESVIAQNGVVFGAKLDDRFQVVHCYAEDLKGVKEFQGSKYVQSKIGNTYIEARQFLEEGKIVLYSGTPCQIEGLKTYLGKEYDNLISIDIICHGVPSPKVWRKYVEFQSQQLGEIKKVSFRNKSNGWKDFLIRLEFLNGTIYNQKISKDFYMRAFLQNVSLRPSCGKCQYKKLHRTSDITLADFWGVVNLFPEMDDDKGTSAVIIHSIKGQEVFEALKEKILFEQVKVEQIAYYNPAMIESVKVSKYRKKYFANLDELCFDMLSDKYTKRYQGKYKNIIVSILRKMHIHEWVKRFLINKLKSAR